MGSLLGIGSLAGANELVAFRVSGVSRLRLAVAGMAGTLLITIPVMAIGEWVAPDAEQQARAFRLKSTCRPGDYWRIIRNVDQGRR